MTDIGKKDLLQEGDAQIALFRKKEIRQVFHNNEWYFSVVDVVHAIADTDRPSQYWNDLKTQLSDKEGFSELYGNIVKLPMPSADGKHRRTEAVNAETLFRVVQSIPSPKADPFKKWLARVGYERIQETQDPEIAIKRAMLDYKAKGYPDEWINERVQSIVSRKELTSLWKATGIKALEYALLTDAISLATFDLKTKQHKQVKGLNNSHNLRDHMTPIELALTVLGETMTSEVAKFKKAYGFGQHVDAAKVGGKVAGNTRRNIENLLNKKVVSEKNYLPKERKQRGLEIQSQNKLTDNANETETG
ncbi:MAG: BRO family protein [Gammaproteobacteria bacterium]|nr:BRO family protein [Gammaproteobacteria bacterium]